MDASPHVLVVDDHREIREPLACYLERHGLRVTVAESAAAGRRDAGFSAAAGSCPESLLP